MRLNDKDIEQLRNGHLFLHCSEIIFCLDDGSLLYSGPGTIRQISTGLFEIAIICNANDYPNRFFQYLEKMCPGTLTSTIGKFNIKATDLDNNVWESISYGNPIIPTWSSKSTHYITKAHVSALWNKSSFQKRSRDSIPPGVPINLCELVSYHEKDPFENENKTYSFCDYELNFSFQNGRLDIIAKSNSDLLHPFIENRIAEAFLFSHGIHFKWTIVNKFDLASSYYEIRPNLSPDKNHLCPLQSPFNEINAFEILFGKYFEFVIKDVDNTSHPLSNCLHDTGDNDFVRKALRYSTAVENITNKYFKHTTAPTINNDDLIAYVETWDGDSQTKTRAINLIKSMRNVRVADILFILVNNSVTNEENVKAWKQLRNPFCHGNSSCIENDFQKAVDDLGKIKVLIFHLVFHLIGYSGVYLDYGNRYAPKKYPLKAK